MSKPDLDSPAHIRQFIDAFYGKLLSDDELAPIFLDVAQVNLDHHLPHIQRYWEKLLLKSADYRRHTMNIHRAVHARRALTARDFERWLAFFKAAVDEGFAGEKAERAKTVAGYIAGNMQKSLSGGSLAPAAKPV